jgi:hypothetical protein
MPLFESVEAGDRVILLTEARQIEEDWKMASCWWWSRYVPRSAKDEDLCVTFRDIHCSKLVRDFLTLWQNRTQESMISWTFPLHDATKLVIRAFALDQGRAKCYVVFDVANRTVGIAEDGTLFLGNTLGNSNRPQAGMLITRERIANYAVEIDQDLAPLETAAARVDAALQKLVGAASRVNVS